MVGRCRKRERERKKGGRLEKGAERESEKKGVGRREACEARRRANPANHEAESCYITGGGGEEETRVQTSEICCTDAHTSHIPNEGCIPRKIFESYTKLGLFQGRRIPRFQCIWSSFLSV